MPQLNGYFVYRVHYSRNLLEGVKHLVADHQLVPPEDTRSFGALYAVINKRLKKLKKWRRDIVYNWHRIVEFLNNPFIFTHKSKAPEGAGNDVVGKTGVDSLEIAGSTIKQEVGSAEMDIAGPLCDAPETSAHRSSFFMADTSRPTTSDTVTVTPCSGYTLRKERCHRCVIRNKTILTYQNKMRTLKKELKSVKATKIKFLKRALNRKTNQAERWKAECGLQKFILDNQHRQILGLRRIALEDQNIEICKQTNLLDLHQQVISSSSSPVVSKLWSHSMLGKWNVTNFRVVDTPYLAAKLTIPGFGFESTDRHGNPKIATVLFHSVMARVYSLNRPNGDSSFLDWATLIQNRLSFVSSVAFTFSPELYNPYNDKSALNAEVYLGYLGNTSTAHVIKAFLPENDREPLWTQIIQNVCLDKETRKPIAFPDWYVEKYKEKGILDKGLFIDPITRPSKTFTHQIPIVWSDTDNNNHTNFTSYVNFAVNALHAATGQTNNSSTACVLHGVSKDTLPNGLKELQVRYLGESQDGEGLNVHIWQEEHDDTVLCSIERDETVLCQVKLVYFNDSLYQKSLPVFT
ncbi:uncharacterized protein LOC131954494 [Physella acuta]|uniref:uncharacterized protein LOC131954494 n=1 Tax=Physella acuta TaxID=109671 RepID=UPI0027DCF10C|nr:uncharacterized protein LOC131954494 [Physella acuta]